MTSNSASKPFCLAVSSESKPSPKGASLRISHAGGSALWILMSTPSPSPSRLTHSLKETAELLGVAEVTVRRLVARRLLRRVQGIRHIRITRAAIDEFLRG